MNAVKTLAEIAISVEKSHIQVALGNLRSHFPAGTSDNDILHAVLGETQDPPANEVPKKAASHISKNPDVDGKCNRAKLIDYAEKKRNFTSAQAAKHFGVTKMQMAGYLTKVSGTVLQKKGPDARTGSTRWTYISGSK